MEVKEKTWQIDRLRCVVCDCCVEVCPTKCLTMDTQVLTGDDHSSRVVQGAGSRAEEGAGTGGGWGCSGWSEAGEEGLITIYF